MATSTLTSASASSILTSASSIATLLANSTTPSLPSATDLTAIVPIGEDGDDDDDTQLKGNNIMYYYFFVFLSVIIAILLLGCYAYSRRRRARRLQDRNIGQTHLQRDLENWTPGNRRANLFGVRGLNRRRTDPDEGFNEFGEAPPVYKAKDDGVSSRVTTGVSSDGTDTIAVPLQTLSRDGTSGLPDYDDIVKETAISPVIAVQTDGAGTSDPYLVAPITAHVDTSSPSRPNP